MEFVANLEVLEAALQPPPAYEAPAHEDDLTPLPGLVLELDEPSVGGRNAVHRERLRRSRMVSRPVPPQNKQTHHAAVTNQIGRRLIGADDQGQGAFTEAITDTRAHPYSSVGKLTASFNGRYRHCTATVVAERVVMTAAHCVFARKTSTGQTAQFADWVTFEPGYNNGVSAGRWAGEATYIHSGWGNPQPGTNAGPFDYAFIRLDTPIARVTGIASLVTDAAPQGPFTALGYPRYPREGFRFDGRFLYATTGKRIEYKGVGTIQAENGLTEGSSGGPWFTQTEYGPGVVGINSTKPAYGDDSTWSPIFSDSFQSLLARVLADMTGT